MSSNSLTPVLWTRDPQKAREKEDYFFLSKMRSNFECKAEFLCPTTDLRVKKSPDTLGSIPGGGGYSGRTVIPGKIILTARRISAKAATVALPSSCGDCAARLPISIPTAARKCWMCRFSMIIFPVLSVILGHYSNPANRAAIEV